MPISISLVIPTIRRTKELMRLFESIQNQKDFDLASIECILVDQNPEGYLNEILGATSLKINHLKIKPQGLSNAKNAGLKEAHGEIILFPDDDCWFHPLFLNQIKSVFEANPSAAGVFFRATDPDLKKDLVPFSKKIEVLDIPTADAFCAPQIAQAYKTTVVKEVGGFDETLGAGAREFGSGEDTDLALRVLGRYNTIVLDSKIEIWHPWVSSENMTPEKAFLYAKGFGAVCVKNELYVHWVYKILKQLMAFVFYLFTLKPFLARQSLTIAWGRFLGGVSYPTSKDL